MHSTGSISRRRTSTARPATASGTSVETTWLGTTSASCSNHHSDSCVRTLPLSGISLSRMWSNAEIRSEATSSSWSVRGRPVAGSTGA